MKKETRGRAVRTTVASPPDGGWGWWIVVASFLCNFLVDGMAYSFGVMIRALSEAFGSTAAETSLVGSLLCGMYLLNAPIAGLLVKRFGCRVVTIVGAVLASLSFLISAFSSSLLMLTVTYGGFAGFGFGFIYLPSIVSVGFYFERRRALATGIAMSGSGLGTFACSSIANAVLEHEGWRYTLIIVAAIVLHCAIAGSLMRPLKHEIIIHTNDEEDKKRMELIPLRLQADLAHSDPTLNRNELQVLSKQKQKLNRSTNDVYSPTVVACRSTDLMHKKDLFYSGSFRNIPTQTRVDYEYKEKETGRCGAVKSVLKDMCDLSLLRDWRFVMIVLGNVFGMMGLYVPYVYLTDRAVLLGVEPAQAALLVSFVGISNTIGRVVSGVISDIPRMKALWVNNACLLGTAVATLLCPLCLSYPSMAVYAAVFGFFVAGYIAMTPVILCDILGLDKLTSCFSLLTLVRGITAVAGTPIAGMIYDLTMSYDVSFYYGGAMMLLCFIFHALLMVPGKCTPNS